MRTVDSFVVWCLVALVGMGEWGSDWYPVVVFRLV